MEKHVIECVKSNIKVILGGLAVILMIGLLIGYMLSHPAQYTPADGTWYCDALAIQLSYDDPGESYILVDGEKIKCIPETDRGSDWLSVTCQESDNKHFRLGEVVLSGQIVHLDEETHVIREELTDTEYTFTRIG